MQRPVWRERRNGIISSSASYATSSYCIPLFLGPHGLAVNLSTPIHHASRMTQHPLRRSDVHDQHVSILQDYLSAGILLILNVSCSAIQIYLCFLHQITRPFLLMICGPPLFSCIAFRCFNNALTVQWSPGRNVEDRRNRCAVTYIWFLAVPAPQIHLSFCAMRSIRFHAWGVHL